MSPLRLFVGYDADEALAGSVFAHSILRRASRPVAVTQLVRAQLAGIHKRPRDPLQSTEFAFTRFLVPWLCGYQGWAVFADGDMLCQADIAELFALADDRYAAQVVQHAPLEQETSTKFLGRVQTPYRRKNWSSVMLFNCAKCEALTPEYVDTAHGLELHGFDWADNAEIGALPAEWNHLVGIHPKNVGAKIVHYTLGMPFFRGFNECEYANEWRTERDAMMAFARG